jgi:hypothetical protein
VALPDDDQRDDGERYEQQEQSQADTRRDDAQRQHDQLAITNQLATWVTFSMAVVAESNAACFPTG